MPENNRQLNRKFLTGMIFFLVFLGLFVFSGKKTQAAVEGACVTLQGQTEIKEVAKDSNGNLLLSVTKDKCPKGATFIPKSDPLYGRIPARIAATQAYNAQTAAAQSKSSAKSCTWYDPSTWIICFLEAILAVAKGLLVLSATIFAWIVKPERVAYIFQNPAIYESWKMVRDILNIAFILVLLFSAFSTIFQIDKYNYKKILLTLVIMALLVNFSYPIARFIIDVSNVAMYDIVNKLFTVPADQSFVKITENSGLKGLVKDPGTEPWNLFFLIIFIFILAITFLAIGVLLMIRVIALAILTIFSPIAFVANIFPSTSNYSGQWWENFFKYAFFGPIMMLALHISIQIMSYVNNKNSFQMEAQNIIPGTPPVQDTISSFAMLSIPIILLWMSMGLAQKMSIAGAGAVMGKAQGFMKGTGKFAMKGFGIPKATGLTGGLKKFGEDFKKTGKMFGVKPLKYLGFSGSEAREGRERAVSSFVSGGVSGYRDAKLEEERKKVQEKRDEWKKLGGADVDDLAKILDDRKASLIEKRAAALEMAEKTGFGNASASDAQKLANYQKAMASLAGDAVNLRNFQDKTKEKHIKIIIDNDVANGVSKKDAYDNNLGKMTAEQLSKQRGLLSDGDFITHYLAPKSSADPKFIEEVAKKLSQADRAAWKDYI